MRSFDAKTLNSIVNDPSVLPWVTLPGEGPLDTTGLVYNPDNVLLMEPPGKAIIFLQQWPGVYEAHSQFLPSFRGKAALEFGRTALHWMFTCSNCMEVQTKVPANNPGARVMLQYVGAELDFVRRSVWPTADGLLVDLAYWSLAYREWWRKARGLTETGEWFHKVLDQEMKAVGIDLGEHPPDSAHDRAVGAAVDMIRGGQLEKAVLLYNFWARFAGYPFIRLISSDPVVLDVGSDVLVYPWGDTFKVVPPQSAASVDLRQALLP